ncbi:protoheme ix farnesyltransferase, putative, partial [Perkinsus marinus ATCC 50983]
MLLISSSSSSRRFAVSVTSKIINSAKVLAGVEMRNSICIITTRTSTSTGAPADIKPPLVNLKVARLVSLDARNEVVVGGGRSKMNLKAVARDYWLQTLWQFPHFYALAWLYRSDYSAAGYKMFPLDDDTGHKTAAMCLPYMVGLAVLPVVASGLGVTSWMFAFSAMV